MIYAILIYLIIGCFLFWMMREDLSQTHFNPIVLLVMWLLVYPLVIVFYKKK